MLAHGAGVDQCDEVINLRASTALKCLKKFCAQVKYLYGVGIFELLMPQICKGFYTKDNNMVFPA